MVIAETIGSTRSYKLKIHNKTYEIDKIHLFDESGIVLQNQSGWFEARTERYSERDIPSVDLGEVLWKNKRTMSFKSKVPFIVPTLKERYDTYLQAELYLPLNEDWAIRDELETMDSLKDCIIRYYHHKVWGCDFRQHIRNIPKEKNVAFTEQVRKLLKPMFQRGDLEGSIYISWNYIAENKEAIIKAIKEVADEL